MVTGIIVYSLRVTVLVIIINYLFDLSLYQFEVIILQILLLREDAHELVVFGRDREVDDLSTDDHDQDQVFEYIHQVIFHAAVVLLQTYLG